MERLGIGQHFFVELATQTSVSHIELKQQVTRRQGHVRHITNVPCTNDQTATIWIRSNLLLHIEDLIDALSISRFPRPPLLSVDRPQLSFGIAHSSQIDTLCSRRYAHSFRRARTKATQPECSSSAIAWSSVTASLAKDRTASDVRTD